MERAALVCALVGLVACAGADGGSRRPTSIVEFGGSDAFLQVLVADTPAARREGLMGVRSLPTDRGMAFVFDGPVRSTFWMKDTLIPLSIAFIDADGRVIGFRDMQPCEADPCPLYGIDGPYVLAIEANLGWFDDHGIVVGDRAELRRGAYG